MRMNLENHSSRETAKNPSFSTENLLKNVFFPELFDESRKEKTPVLKKQIGCSVLGLGKPNFKTKIIHFEKSHNAENCKRGTL